MKQATAIRLFLLGLPIGLVLTTTGSLIWHFNKPQGDQAPKIYTTLAEEITEPTLAGYVKNLSEVIGERHASKPATLERTANYLESTLGKRNLGYEIKRQVFEVDGQTAQNLWVEIPGGKRINEGVVIVTHYDAPAGEAGRNNNASGVAALLALAENFAREKPMLTMRLAFLAHGTAPHAGTPGSGASHFADLLKSGGDQIQAVFCLDSLGAFPQGPLAIAGPASTFLPENGPFLSLLANSGSEQLLASSFDRLAPMVRITTQQAIVPENARQVLTQSTAGAFHDVGFQAIVIRGNGAFGNEADLPVDLPALTATTQALSAMVRVLCEPLENYVSVRIRRVLGICLVLVLLGIWVLARLLYDPIPADVFDHQLRLMMADHGTIVAEASLAGHLISNEDWPTAILLSKLVNSLGQSRASEERRAKLFGINLKDETVTLKFFVWDEEVVLLDVSQSSSSSVTAMVRDIEAAYPGLTITRGQTVSWY